MSEPNLPTQKLPGAEGRMMLDSAARLLDDRIAAIRGGSAPLHVLLELERASRAIRCLADDLDRLHDPGRAGGRAAGVGALRGPPVLQRGTRRR